MVPNREEYRGLMTKNWNKLYGSAVESSFFKMNRIRDDGI